MTLFTRGRIIAILAALLLVGSMLGLAGCMGDEGAKGPTGDTGPKGETGDAGDNITLLCVACHEDEGIVATKIYQWELSAHGKGEVWEREGGANNCTACHSATGFMAWTAAGGATSDITADPDNTPIDCRGCHEIHTTYTPADFTLRASDPVTMMVPKVYLLNPDLDEWTTADAIYDAGKSNLCANCHQSRTASPIPNSTGEVGVMAISSSHYGPHHGPQATVMLGVNGYGVEGEESPHYTQIEDGCVTCHMHGDPNFPQVAVEGSDPEVGGGHTFSPTLEACQECHEGLDTFDRHGVQTGVQQRIDELGELLIEHGVMTEEGDPIPGTYTEQEVGAWFNYIYAVEDGSLGVHNPNYIEEILDKSIEDLS